MFGHAVEAGVPKVPGRPYMRDTTRVHRLPGPSSRLAQSVLHISVIACASCLWFWHLGKLAAKQPVAQKYGWFFNYMTFDTLTLQLIQYVLALPGDIFKRVPMWWRRLVDDFACAMFGPVLFVTLSFYGMQFLPLQPLYGDDYQVLHIKDTMKLMNALNQVQPACYARHICVPAWVPLGLHSGNSIAAVLDLLVCLRQRSFSKRAEFSQTCMTLAYVLWLMLCRYYTGVFPYPFMEKLPLSWGFVLVCVFMITSCELLFGFGRRIHLTLTLQRRSNIMTGSSRDSTRQADGEDHHQSSSALQSARTDLPSSHMQNGCAKRYVSEGTR